MGHIRFHEHADDQDIAYSVIAAQSGDKWVFCKHRARDTYEVPGGRREPGETPEQTARRELYEETGALKYTLTPICVYSVQNKGEEETYGMLYYAEIFEFGPLPAFEMERVLLCDEPPGEWTYPTLQPILTERVRAFLRGSRDPGRELRRWLAGIADREARRGYHGAAMGLGPNIQFMVDLFPKGRMEEFDGKWCAAFVYYCLTQTGYELPPRVPEARCSFAGCPAWEDWAKLPENGFWHRPDEPSFTPEPGDIVLYDRVFENVEHDHIGVIVRPGQGCITVAEGNFNNVSAVIQRPWDEHIRGIVRIERK